MKEELDRIASDKPPREGWDEAFRAADSNTNDELLLGGLPPNLFDRKDWKWLTHPCRCGMSRNM